MENKLETVLGYGEEELVLLLGESPEEALDLDAFCLIDFIEAIQGLTGKVIHLKDERIYRPDDVLELVDGTSIIMVGVLQGLVEPFFEKILKKVDVRKIAENCFGMKV